MIKACPELLMQELSQLQNTKEHFLELRALDRDIEKFQQLSAVERAARFIFLNKTCYNGLHRVNSKGEFNVPYGKYKNPTIFSTENILACSRSLQGVALSCDSFDRALGAGEGDFVYFDPPYVPIEAVSDFTSYTKEGFGMKQQDQLLELCIDLDKRGVKWMQSNSSGMIVRRMYKDFNIESVTVTRTLQQTGGSRVDEVIITNY